MHAPHGPPEDPFPDERRRRVKHPPVQEHSALRGDSLQVRMNLEIPHFNKKKLLQAGGHSRLLQGHPAATGRRDSQGTEGNEKKLRKLQGLT